jgi:hypothetical protein
MGRKKSAPRRHQPRSSTSIADALFTKGQQRVLAVIFGNAGRSFYASEIIALANSGSGAVQRELARLEDAGLVTVRRVGNQKHYQANPEAPVFEELRSVVLKTSGLASCATGSRIRRERHAALGRAFGRAGRSDGEEIVVAYRTNVTHLECNQRLRSSRGSRELDFKVIRRVHLYHSAEVSNTEISLGKVASQDDRIQLSKGGRCHFAPPG